MTDEITKATYVVNIISKFYYPKVADIINPICKIIGTKLSSGFGKIVNENIIGSNNKFLQMELARIIARHMIKDKNFSGEVDYAIGESISGLIGIINANKNDKNLSKIDGYNYIDLSNLYMANGEVDKAINSLKAAENIFEGFIDGKRGLGIARVKLGDIINVLSMKEGEYEPAKHHYQKALGNLESELDKGYWSAALGITQNNILANQGKLKEAEKGYKVLLRLMNQVERPSNDEIFLQAEARLGLGNVLQKLNKAKEAADLYDIIIDDKDNDRDQLIWNTIRKMAIVGKANACLKLENYLKAIECYGQCKVILDKLGDEFGANIALMNKGLAYYKMGSFNEALKAYNEIIDEVKTKGDLDDNIREHLHSKIEDILVRCIFLMNKGTAYRSRYDPRNAIYADDLIKADVMYSWCLEEYKNIAGRQDIETKLFDLEFSSYEELNLSELNAQILGNIGIIFFDKGEYEKAIEVYKNAREILANSKDNLSYIRLSMYLGAAYNNSKKSPDAYKTWIEVRDILGANKDSEEYKTTDSWMSKLLGTQ